MSTEDNKQIVKKAQEILKEYGHEVKTSHIYEMFSKLSGYKDWNTASAKKSVFQNILSKITTASEKMPYKSVLSKEFLKKLLSGEYLNKFNLGKSKDTNKEVVVDFVQSPNVIFTGGMGSGKSVAASYTALTWMLANGDKSILFLVDLLKGMSDYQYLWKNDEFDQVIPVVGSNKKVLHLIDLLYEEMLARRVEILKTESSNLYDYEKKSGKSVARLVTVIEEFNYMNTLLNYSNNYNIKDTYAYKFHHLVRIGRSCGIWFIVASGRASPDDFPPTMAPNFTNKMVFRTSKSDSQYLLGNESASILTIHDKGTCMTDQGKVQFPFMQDEEKRELIRKYSKKLTSSCLTHTLEEIKELVNDETFNIKPTDKKELLVRSMNLYDPDLVIANLYESMGYSVSILSQNHLLIIKDNSKILCLNLMKENSRGISDKQVFLFVQEMEKNDCQLGIINTSVKDVPLSLYTASKNLGITINDWDEVLNMAKKIDSK